MPETHDRRLHPVRPDLAARAYEGRVEAARFVDGVPRRVVRDRAGLRSEPRPDRSIDTEVLYGETFTVYEETQEGWAWGQLATDGYVGWVPADALGPLGPAPTHRVAALRTYRYPGPELKLPPLGLLSIGSLVTVADWTTVRGLDYALLADGSAVVARHLVSCDAVAEDWVAVAESFLGTPYLWGGRSSLGLDCSALVQLAAQAGGLTLPRDSDMQETSAGDVVAIVNGLPDLSRGDLLFWKGHVGILRDPDTLLHANGFTMTVASEPLRAAIDRIAASSFGAVTALRRLTGR